MNRSKEINANHHDYYHLLLYLELRIHLCPNPRSLLRGLDAARNVVEEDRDEICHPLRDVRLVAGLALVGPKISMPASVLGTYKTAVK